MHKNEESLSNTCFNESSYDARDWDLLAPMGKWCLWLPRGIFELKNSLRLLFHAYHINLSMAVTLDPLNDMTYAGRRTGLKCSHFLLEPPTSYLLGAVRERSILCSSIDI
jgi:hypothetical protein